jgi:hypothetical protein
LNYILTYIFFLNTKNYILIRTKVITYKSGLYIVLEPIKFNCGKESEIQSLIAKNVEMLRLIILTLYTYIIKEHYKEFDNFLYSKLTDVDSEYYSSIIKTVTKSIIINTLKFQQCDGLDSLVFYKSTKIFESNFKSKKSTNETALSNSSGKYIMIITILNIKLYIYIYIYIYMYILYRTSSWYQSIKQWCCFF